MDVLGIKYTQEPAKPLKLGMSIGQEGQTVTGTLGAFVEDVESKEVFVLSCDHVMKGAEGDTNVPIVQPSLLDTVRKLQSKVWTYIKHSPLEIQEDLKDVIYSLEEKCKHVGQLTKEEINSEFVKCCQMTDEYFTSKGTECKCVTGLACGCDKCQLGKYEENFLKIYRKQPRKIATYTDGVKGNIEGVNEEEGLFFVDAAIAKLENSELQKLEETERVQLADTSKTKNTMGGRYPLKMTDLDLETRIFKCGRKTETTYGYLESKVALREKHLYLMVRDGYNEPRKFLFHVAFPQFYCDTCAHKVGLPHKGDTESPTTEDCTACHQRASCHPYYASYRTFCKSCAKKRGIIWDDVTEDIPATCVLCNQMKPCCVDVSLPRYLCGSCSNQAQAAETPEIATLKTCCDKCGEPKVCSPYHDEEPGYQSEGELQMQTPEQEPEHQWHQNCLLIGDTEMGEHAFARGGDSGAVLFDEDGNAVGLLFGCLVSRTGKLIYGLASPMEVVLRELEVKTGRKLELKTEFAQ